MKRKLMSLVVTLALCSTVLAGQIGYPGYAPPFAATEGYYWQLIENLWYMLSLT